MPQLAAQSLSLPEVAPGGQQPSPLRGTVIGVNRQCALQVPPSTTSSVVHASPSSQLVGHTPAPEVIAVSHISPGSRWPSPQLAAQSLSLPELAPGGQQPSPLTGVVIGTFVHRAVHASPIRVSVVHASPSSQLVGHAPGWPLAIAVSQVSPGSSVPLPHRLLGGQVPPTQQPSMGVYVHCAWQLPPFSSASVVQVSPSSQLVGHAPGWPAGMAVSQVSPSSTVPSPHSSALARYFHSRFMRVFWPAVNWFMQLSSL